MRSRILSVLLLALLSVTPGIGAIIDFDDIDASMADVSLDTLGNYKGFAWQNILAYTFFPGFEGFNNAIVSPANAAFSGGDFLSGSTTVPIVGSLTRAEAFDFIGASFGAGYYDNLSLTVEGLRQGNLLFSQTVTVSTTGASPFTFNFIAIDELRLFAGTTSSTSDPFQCGQTNCTQFTVDDLEYSLSPAAGTDVPEPAGFWLVGLGIATISLRSIARSLIG